MSHRSSRMKSRSQNDHLNYQEFEPRRVLSGTGPEAVDLYPDLFAWASESRGYLHDYHVEGNLLRFTTALANDGAGPLEIRGGEVRGDRQAVNQRIYRDDGTFWEREAGEFTYHSGHGHIHFDGYATYNLRAKNVDGSVGDVVASGGKVSFCLIDITKFNPNAGSSEYGSCGSVRQGISAGWSDVYGSGLSDQWINITGIDDGEYFLEVIVDPDDQLVESDETNNVTVIPIEIIGGPGAQGDRYEANNSFAMATVFGLTSERHEAGLSIHTPSDVDYYQIEAVEDGEFDLHLDFVHALGNLDLYVYDADENLVGSSTSDTDLEELHWDVLAGEQYYFKVVGVDGSTNAYELDLHGPGNLVTIVLHSQDTPINIPDGAGSRTPGETISSLITGDDFTITDLNLILNDVQHTWLGDLNFTLASPAGTRATILSSQWEEGGGLLGSENDFFQTTIDDQASTNLSDGTAPYTGSFNNQHSNNDPLAIFNGENAMGDWALEVTDWFTGDTGVLHEWCLVLTGIDNNVGDRFEQNDAFPQATDFATIGQVNETGLSIHKPTDQDFYRFNATANSPITVDVTFLHADGNLDMAIYDSNLEVVGRSESTDDNEQLQFMGEAGELYYVRVYGVDGATADYDLAIDAPDVIGESGTAVATTRWRTILLEQEYTRPVFVTGPVSSRMGDPVVVETRFIRGNRFQIRLAEWNYQDGNHVRETVPYIVIEQGTHLLQDGTVISAGTQSANSTEMQSVAFDSAFDQSPLVLAGWDSISFRNHDVLAPRVAQVGVDGFDFVFQAEEGLAPSTISARLNWIAIQPGSGSNYGTVWEADASGSINHQATDIAFDQAFSNPVFLAGTQSMNELDPFGLRTTRLDSAGASILLQEETSLDAETEHVAEILGWLAMERGAVYGHAVL